MTPSEYLQAHGVTPEAASRWGLILEPERIDFAVTDEYGSVQGVCYCSPDATPKWQVFPTQLRWLAVYGLPQAIACSQTVSNPTVTIVESQTETIARAEAGECVVGAMSCVLTAEQVAIIAAHWSRARLQFDNDPPGQRGTKQAAIMLANAGVTVEP